MVLLPKLIKVPSQLGFIPLRRSKCLTKQVQLEDYCNAIPVEILRSQASRTCTFQWDRQSRCFSASSAAVTIEEKETTLNIPYTTNEFSGPTGDLFQGFQGGKSDIGLSLIGKKGSIRRTFGPRSSAEAMLTCGGEALAAHASFDPNYLRAQGWIRQHAVGPAVLSPVLISGLVGALVEAAFPQSVPRTQSLRILRPLVVGVEINASIHVVDVVSHINNEHCGGMGRDDYNERRNGYVVTLQTEVNRMRDDLVISDGSHSIWIPDYLRM